MASSVTYSVDSSTIITLNRYLPRDIHFGIWHRLEELISDGRLFMTEECLKELERVDDQCAPWAKNCEGFIIPVGPAEMVEVGSISAEFPGWVTEQRNAADPWVIAHAIAHKRRVLTEESPRGAPTSDKNRKLPHVAAARGIQCMGYNDLARLEGWTFKA